MTMPSTADVTVVTPAQADNGSYIDWPAIIAGIVLAAAASLSFTAGILVERWLFFATARHAVMNYY